MIRAATQSARQIRLTEAEYRQRDQQTFLVPWELWAQLRTMSGGKQIAGTMLLADEALSMANWIAEQQSACAVAFAQLPESWLDELRAAAVSWGAHLYLWGDAEGTTVEQLAAFLRGGAVAIVAES